MAFNAQPEVYPSYGVGLGGGIAKVANDASKVFNTANTAVVQAKGIVSTVQGLLGLTKSAPQSDFNSHDGKAFLCGRGTTYQISLADGVAASAAYYAIKEWTDFLNAPYAAAQAKNRAAMLTGGDTFDVKIRKLAPVLFTGMRIGHRDVVGRVLCMDNIKVLYSYGQNFGDVTIGGEILLGNFMNRVQAQETLKTFTDFFWKYRVSNYLSPLTVSMLSETNLVYLEGMDFGDIDLQYHVLPFVLYGTLLDISRDTSYKKRNLSAQVLSTTDITDASIAKAMAATTGIDSGTVGVVAAVNAGTGQPSFNFATANMKPAAIAQAQANGNIAALNGVMTNSLDGVLSGNLPSGTLGSAADNFVAGTPAPLSAHGVTADSMARALGYSSVPSLTNGDPNNPTPENLDTTVANSSNSPAQNAWLAQYQAYKNGDPGAPSLADLTVQASALTGQQASNSYVARADAATLPVNDPIAIGEAMGNGLNAVLPSLPTGSPNPLAGGGSWSLVSYSVPATESSNPVAATIIKASTQPAATSYPSPL